jgi:SAM-dependent methyltransferase
MDEELRRQTRDGYDTVAAAYARLLPDTRHEAAPDLAMVRHLVTSLTVAVPPPRVLDAGCGTGRMIEHLRSIEPSLDVVGVDLSPGMVAEARAAHPGTRIDEGALTALPYEDGSFDGVLAWYSIIHTPPHGLAPVLGELRRVLRTGGRLLLGYQSGTGHRRLDRPYGHDVEMHAFLHHTPFVQAALETAGFTIDTTLDRGARPDERFPQGFVLAAGLSRPSGIRSTSRR